jgi:polyisoprenoid-binding protein YceI
MSGTIYVPDDQSRSTFEVRVPVDQLTIDEPELRSKEGPDFPAEVPDAAKQGTRRNMLSEALLNGAQYPDIILMSQHIGAPAAASAPAMAGAPVQADVQVTIRGQAHSLSVPVTYSFEDSRLIVSGDLPIKQTDLGLTPFSAMLGALQVQDELRVRFRIVARRAQTTH